MTGVGAIGIVCLFLGLVILHADVASPPALLQRLLQSQKAWRLFNPRIDLPGEEPASLAIIESNPPWIVGDLDHDGRDDVAAVVVSGSPSRRRFGVVAVHAATPRLPRWVVPLNAKPIVGVVTEPFADTVEPEFCTECDINPWFRWSGRGYELGLFATGDSVALGDDRAAGADLLSRPLTSGAKRAHVQPCAEARVHDVAGRPRARWYFVETTIHPRTRGWVAARVVIAPGGCF
jgi:hypothetical protein